MLCGADRDPRIVPFRGAYHQLRAERRSLVRGLVYPVPDPRLPFLGIHLTPTIDGRVLVGPSALLTGARDGYRLGALNAQDLRDTLAWPGTWRMARRWWRTGLEEARLAARPRAFAGAAARYVPAIEPGDLTPAFAGVRAQAVSRDGRLTDDFLLSTTPRAIHVRNAPSPAATSALALAALIADHAEQLREPRRRAITRSREGEEGTGRARKSPKGPARPPFPPPAQRLRTHAIGDDDSPMRILLTGASGSIGAALAPALIEAGHDVRGFGRDPSRVPATLDFVRETRSPAPASTRPSTASTSRTSSSTPWRAAAAPASIR